MNVEIKEGTKPSDGIEISLGDLLDVRGQFNERGEFVASKITIVPREKHNEN